ncbi:MAG: hypothetical protein KF819_24035 [Labilithrix sp.]|nr:hypothetical protein [Labilithrix sp.]
MSLSTRQIAFALFGTALVLSCSDPVLDGAVAAQGNETSGVEKGEFHRAGQACVVCHQSGGPAADYPFTVAGTVFAQPLRQVGVEAAEIRMTDAEGTKHIAKTNCVGNFFVKSSEWNPRFPILVEIAKGSVRRVMQTPIGQSKSCAGCHELELPNPDPFTRVGHIYLYGGDEPGSPEGAADCKVNPVRPGSP